MKPDGTINLAAHTHLVLAIGGLTNDSPLWTTILLRRDQLDNKDPCTAMQACMPIPLFKVPSGGRNSILYSPSANPVDEASLNCLFTTPGKLAHARGYAKCIWYTPLELCSEFHCLTLARWDSMQDTNPSGRHQGLGPMVKKLKPPPSAPDLMWKRWLTDRCELHRQLQYTGIPLIGQGYQKLHLKGTKALLAFLPLNKKGTSVRLSPLRDTFLHQVAMLLTVPECYQQQLIVLGVVVSAEWQTTLYIKANFAVASRISVNNIIRFLASAGIQPEEAERWRSWVAAFIEMELEDHPTATHAPLFRFVHDRAMALIEGDPKWVLTGLHPDLPGNWDPHLKRQHKERVAKLQATQSEAGPSSAPAGTSGHPEQSLPAHTGGADPLADALNYDSADNGYSEDDGSGKEHDDDTLMGPG